MINLTIYELDANELIKTIDIIDCKLRDIESRVRDTSVNNIDCKVDSC